MQESFWRERENFSRADGRAKERVFPEGLEGEPAEIFREKARLVVQVGRAIIFIHGIDEAGNVGQENQWHQPWEPQTRLWNVEIWRWRWGISRRLYVGLVRRLLPHAVAIAGCNTDTKTNNEIYVVVLACNCNVTTNLPSFCLVVKSGNMFPSYRICYIILYIPSITLYYIYTFNFLVFLLFSFASQYLFRGCKINTTRK